jgi:hypothetical protein
VTRLPDVPRLKCGHEGISIRYCDGTYAKRTYRDQCRLGEHFHRYCRRCSYEWETYGTVADWKLQRPHGTD